MATSQKAQEPSGASGPAKRLLVIDDDVELCELVAQFLHREGFEAELVYDGQWFGPLRQAVDAFIDQTQSHVTGDVRLRFDTGSCTVVGRTAESSLYDLSLATYGGDDAFDQSDAAGYVRLFGLPLKVWAAKQGR